MNQETTYIIKKSYFDYVNNNAEVIILGITPGNNQLAENDFIKGKSLKEIKKEFAFAGTMRSNLIRELDEIQLNKYLEIDSCKSLWNEDFDKVEMTSLLKNAVYYMRDGKEQMFNEPEKIRRNEQLIKEFEIGFKKDCKKYKNLKLIIALGDKTKFVADELKNEGFIPESVNIIAIPHAAGSNNGQIAFFMGTSDKEKYDNEKMELFNQSKKVIKKMIKEKSK